MVETTEIHRVHGELSSLRGIVEKSEGLSDRANFDDFSKKTLLLAAASFFERNICDAILSAISSNGLPDAAREFLRKQALSRKYHTMFNWEASNLNQFFGLFGEDAKTFFKAKAEEENQVENIGKFIYINSERNRLVHQNYAAYSIDALFEEIWAKFLDAKKFVDWFEEKLREKVGKPGD